MKIRNNFFKLLLSGIAVFGLFFFIRYLSAPKPGVVRYKYPVREEQYSQKEKIKDPKRKLSPEERRKMRKAFREKRRREENKIRQLISTTQGKIDYLLHYYPKSGSVMDSILKYGKDAREKEVLRQALMEEIDKCRDGTIPVAVRDYLSKRMVPDKKILFLAAGAFITYLRELSPQKGIDIKVKKFIDDLITDPDTHPDVKGALIFNSSNRYLMDHKDLIRSFVTHENSNLFWYAISFCESIKDHKCIPQINRLLKMYKDKGLEDSPYAGMLENSIRYIQGRRPIPREEVKRRRARFLRKFPE